MKAAAVADLFIKALFDLGIRDLKRNQRPASYSLQRRDEPTSWVTYNDTARVDSNIAPVMPVASHVDQNTPYRVANWWNCGCRWST